MAGGTFTTYSKNRPGAYINIKAKPKQSVTLAQRGIVTFPTNLSWGADNSVIEVTGTDLFNGTALKKIGLNAADKEAVYLREAFKNAHTALVYKINTGGVKATAQLATNITAVAACSGTFGNKIKVVVKKNENKFDVVTMVDGHEADIQTVSSVAEFQSNGWIELSGEDDLKESAGVALEGGTDGTTSDTNYRDYTNLISTYKWNVMFIPSESVSLHTIIIDFIKKMREEKGKKVQAVICQCEFDVADYEGIINTFNGYVTPTETIDPATFTAYMAGVTAGAEVAQSNTYHVIPDATDIIDPLDDEEIEHALTQGVLVLSRRQDGAIVIEKDINSLHTFGDDKSYDFSKNLVIRTLDDIANEVAVLYENKYIGKVQNTENGRTIFKGELIGYFNRLQDLNAIEDFDSNSDIEVLPGTDKESIIVNVAVKVTDSMEKLFMSLTVS